MAGSLKGGRPFFWGRRIHGLRHDSRRIRRGMRAVFRKGSPERRHGSGWWIGPREGVCGNRRTVVRNSVGSRLHGLLDQPGAETAGADADAMGRAVDQGPDRLEIGLEHAFGLVVGMTDVVPGMWFLSTQGAGIGHGSNSSSNDQSGQLRCGCEGGMVAYKWTILKMGRARRE